VVVKDTSKLYGATIQFWHAKISVNPKVEWVMMPLSTWSGPVLFVMPNHPVQWGKKFGIAIAVITCHVSQYDTV
jgi:hypothetical protein